MSFDIFEGFPDLAGSIKDTLEGLLGEGSLGEGSLGEGEGSLGGDNGEVDTTDGGDDKNEDEGAGEPEVPSLGGSLGGDDLNFDFDLGEILGGSLGGSLDGSFGDGSEGNPEQ